LLVGVEGADQAVQRRLAGAGTRHLTIKNHHKRHSAIEILMNTALTIEEVSAKLIFSETSPFTRTFKPWAGVPPCVYRENLTDFQSVRF